jgi:hypothetical protein
MPVDSELCVLIRGKVDLEYLNYLRQELQDELGLTDSYFKYGGPLKILEKSNYEYEQYNLYTPLTEDEYTWLDVNITNPYYGIGYERGSIRLLVQIAEWMERVFPTCQIYYGPDYGDCLYLFDEGRREYLLRHYRKVGRCY